MAEEFSKWNQPCSEKASHVQTKLAKTIRPYYVSCLPPPSSSSSIVCHISSWLALWCYYGIWALDGFSRKFGGEGGRIKRHVCARMFVLFSWQRRTRKKKQAPLQPLTGSGRGFAAFSPGRNSGSTLIKFCHKWTRCATVSYLIGVNGLTSPSKGSNIISINVKGRGAEGFHPCYPPPDVLICACRRIHPLLDKASVWTSLL